MIEESGFDVEVVFLLHRSGRELVVEPQTFIGRRRQRQQGNEEQRGISHDRLILGDSQAARQERIRFKAGDMAEKIHWNFEGLKTESALMGALPVPPGIGDGSLESERSFRSPG
jgi:hypothetical protein